MIGDRAADITAGNRAGCLTIAVATNQFANTEFPILADATAQGLPEAVQTALSMVAGGQMY